MQSQRPPTTVTGRRLLELAVDSLALPSLDSPTRRLLATNSSGVQIALDIQAPASQVTAVSQALQQSVSSGAFQASLAKYGEDAGLLAYSQASSAMHSMQG